MMQKSDLEKFTTMLAELFSVYERELSAIQVKLWWKTLQFYDLYAIEHAISLFLGNPDVGQFAPKPADIVKMMEGSTLDSAMAAWSKVDSAVRGIGTFASVVFDDRLIHHIVVEMGGWIQLGTKKEDDWPFLRNHFVNLYKGYQARREYPAYRRVLIGIADAQNQSKGYKKSIPVLIGIPALCMEVMNGGDIGPMLEVTRPSKNLQIAYGGPLQPLQISLVADAANEESSNHMQLD